MFTIVCLLASHVLFGIAGFVYGTTLNEVVERSFEDDGEAVVRDADGWYGAA